MSSSFSSVLLSLYSLESKVEKILKLKCFVELRETVASDDNLLCVNAVI